MLITVLILSMAYRNSNDNHSQKEYRNGNDYHSQKQTGNDTLTIMIIILKIERSRSMAL